MAVRVITKRKMAREKEGELLPLLKQLRARATVQPGYISGETLRNINQTEEYLVISTWKRVSDWETWVSSKQRAEIQEKVDALLRGVTESNIYVYG